MDLKANSNLEKLYDRFKQRVGEDLNDGKVDYLGINISQDQMRDTEFKMYYTDAFSRTETHPLVDFLTSENMVRYLTMVNDKNDNRRLRFDIGIKNRTNENMERMFDWLDKNVEMFRSSKNEIKKLSSMRMTDQEGFKYASLYFIGFIAVDSRIDVLKFHFYNRICDDSDNLYDNYKFDDTYYLEYLRASGIKVFSDLVNIMNLTLRHCGGHLWMTGVDYKKEGSRKYKIYIKHPQKLYDGLLAVFADDKYRVLKDRIEGVKEWNEKHPCFKYEGFAICLDNENKLSINFYYVMRGEVE